MTKKDQAILGNLLQWCVGNRGAKDRNPYAVEEIRDALKHLAAAQGRKPENFFDAADPYRLDWRRFPSQGTEYHGRLRGEYTIWMRVNDSDGGLIHTVLKNDKRPTKNAGGYMSIDAALKVKGM